MDTIMEVQECEESGEHLHKEHFDSTERSTSEDDSDDSDDDAEDDGTLEGEIQAQEEALKNYPRHYDAHVALVNLLRSAGELHKLRRARKRFASVFPLTPALWREWIADEKRVASSEKDRSYVLELYRDALRDYLDVDLWLEYLSDAAEFFSKAEDADKGVTETLAFQRKLFEEAITSCGVHVVRGAEVWQAYRDLESQVAVQALENIEASTGPTALQQEQKIRSLFCRQLRLPLENNDQVMSAFRAWDSYNTLEEESVRKTLIAEATSSHGQAMKVLKTLGGHERNIAKAEQPSYLEEAYLGYLADEVSGGDPSRAQVLFERAVASCCLSPRIWLAYVRFLLWKLKQPAKADELAARALRNVPTSGSIWAQRLRCLELLPAAQSEESYTSLFAEAVGVLTECGAPEDDVLEFLLEYCDSARRRGFRLMRGFDESTTLPNARVCFSSGFKDHMQGPARSVLMSGFVKCHNLLQTRYPAWDNGFIALASYEARILSEVVGDDDAAEQRWADILKKAGQYAAVWLEYIKQQRRQGRLDRCRSAFKRAVFVVKDDPRSIFREFIQFEREWGTLISLDEAERKVESQAQGQVERTSQAIAPGWGQTERTIRKRPARSINGNDSGARGAGKRKRSRYSELPHSAKAGNDEREGTDLNRLFVRNIPFEASEEAVGQVFSSLSGYTGTHLVKNKAGRSRGIAFINFETEVKAREAMAGLDEVELGGRQLDIKVAESSQHDGERKRQDVNENRERRRHDKNKKAKSKADSSAGVKTTSDKPKEGPWACDPKTVYVGDLAESVTTDDLERAVAQHGKVVDAAIAANKYGKSKGYALVEMAEKDAVEKLLDLRDDFTVMGKVVLLKRSRFKVSSIKRSVRREGLSNQKRRPHSDSAEKNNKSIPPKRAEQFQDRLAGHRRSHVTLVPRNVQRSSKSSGHDFTKLSVVKNDRKPAGSNDAVTEGISQMMKSQDDFRKLLMKEG